MVSLWGSKDQSSRPEDSTNPARADGADTEQSQQQPTRSRRSEERHTDERTRLLPPRQDGFLEPDDPAVSKSILLILLYHNCIDLNLR